ncbi:MAG: potassium channel family protein [Euryarchaeota archaeon]|nr:potassium channel family protein [Euryarchaeota archaeon]
MTRKFMLLLEVFFVTVIFLDSFLLLISVLVPVRPGYLQNVMWFDLFASIVLFLGYIINMWNKDPKIYIKRNWNGFIAIIPFYFIGLNILGLGGDLIILKILNFFKILALIMATRQVGRAVDQFVEKSRLVYGFSIFLVILLICSVAFFLVERGVNPQVTNYEDSLWFVIQTITTVGYGDVIPYTQIGRLMGVIAMISAIGVSSLVTAAATSSLIESFRKEREKLTNKSLERIEIIEDKLDGIDKKVEGIQKLDRLSQQLEEIKKEVEKLKKKN